MMHSKISFDLPIKMKGIQFCDGQRQNLSKIPYFINFANPTGWEDADTIGDQHLKQEKSKQVVRPFCTKNKFSAKEGK